MRLYRVAPEHYLSIFNGMGQSYRVGGRWNSPGVPVLYFSCAASTAMLEAANYFPSPQDMPASYRLGVYETPPGLEISVLETADWPHGWAVFPYPETTQRIGDEWLSAVKGFGLMVPSVAVPGGLESNLVVNPAHQEVRNINLLEVHQPPLFNERAFNA